MDDTYDTLQAQGSPGAIRRYNLNMPQMALGGLSEAWLFREIGDMHWEMICDGLQTQSSDLCDANGTRLYATFTRIRLTSTAPLLDFKENDVVEGHGRISRFGAGIFLGDIHFASGSISMSATMMSSFTKRNDPQSNLSLLKGQPAIPSDCAIPVLTALPTFAGEYRRVKAITERPSIFECEYDIQPHHDINGVGLLYFAAYPTINDLSELRFVDDPDTWCLDYGTTVRDVYYFGNCNLGDKITYRLHEERRTDDGVTLTSSLIRSSDSVPIAHLITTKKARRR